MSEHEQQTADTLDALRAVLLYPPVGSSDAEVLAAARAFLRMMERTSPDDS